MSVDRPGAPGPRTAVVVVGSLILAGAGAGWFLLSHTVMGTATVDAAGEAAGVMLGLLILASVVGALTSSRGNRRS